jgi:hypothetical protein
MQQQQQKWALTVSAPPQQGQHLLALVQQVLRSCGASCLLDSKAWAVRYTAPAAGAAAAQSAEAGPPAKRARHSSNLAVLQPHELASSRASGGEISKDQQQQQQQHGQEAAAAAVAAQIDEPEHIQGQVLLYQERRGTFKVELSALSAQRPQNQQRRQKGAPMMLPHISAAAQAQHQRLYQALEQRLTSTSIL